MNHGIFEKNSIILLVGILVVVSIVQMAKKHRSHVHMKVSEIVVPVVLLAVALGFFMFMFPQSSSLMGRASTLNATKNDQTWNSRQQSWTGAEKMIAQSPLTGKGLGSFPYNSYNYTQAYPTCTISVVATPQNDARARNLSWSSQNASYGSITYIGSVATNSIEN